MDEPLHIWSFPCWRAFWFFLPLLSPVLLQQIDFSPSHFTLMKMYLWDLVIRGALLGPQCRHLRFWQILPNRPSEGLLQFTHPPAMEESTFFSTKFASRICYHIFGSLPAWWLERNRISVSLYLHFSCEWDHTAFHMSICYFFFCELNVWIHGLFFYLVIGLCHIVSKSNLNIGEISPLW